MTEEEYIKVQNRIRIQSALDVLRYVIASEEYGLDKERFEKVKGELWNINNKMLEENLITHDITDSD